MFYKDINVILTTFKDTKKPKRNKKSSIAANALTKMNKC